MDLGIAGKTALLMSSTRGLGFGCAAVLVAEGVSVVVNGRNTERGVEAISKLGENAHFVQADISQPAEREHLFREAKAHLGTISILVTNADGPPPGTFIGKSNQDWQTAFELVMLSALDMARRCLPEMIEQGYGRIVNISSTSAKEITPGTRDRGNRSDSKQHLARTVRYGSNTEICTTYFWAQRSLVGRSPAALC